THFIIQYSAAHQHLHSFPTRRSSDLSRSRSGDNLASERSVGRVASPTKRSSRCTSWEWSTSRSSAAQPRSRRRRSRRSKRSPGRSEEHTSELQSQSNLVCRLLLEKKK